MNLGWRWLLHVALPAFGAGSLLPAHFAVAAELPTLAARVTDRTGTLKHDEIVVLEAKLEAFESRRGSQLAVVIVSTTEPESIEQYAVALFEKNALGRAGKDDGALLVVAMEDRAARIEVGYGLEGTLTDLHASRILDEQLVPAFRAGDFRGGIDRTTDAIIARIDSGTDALNIAAAPAATSPTTLPAPAAEAPAGGTPASNDYVHDVDGLLPSGGLEFLSEKLRGFEQRTKHRMALVLLASSPQPLPEYAQATLAAHPIGQSGADDYVMVFATTGDDRIEILVGDGLRPKLPAVERQRIVSEVLVPRLSADRPFDALAFGADTLIATVEGTPLPDDPRPTASRHASAGAATYAAPGALASFAALWVIPDLPAEAWAGGGVMILVISGVLGMLLGGILLWLPRGVRAGIAAVAIVFVLRWFRNENEFDIPLIGFAWGVLVAGLVAFHAKAKWYEGGSGRGGRRSSGSSSRSSGSSSRSWSGGGGRSGGGGASKRW